MNALADLGGVSAFDLRFRWSLRLPRTEESVAFPPSSGERLRAVVKRADQLPLWHSVGVHGPIARIARPTGIVTAADGFTVHHP
ncbi:hypothetical protein BOX37_15900 [Nocardia mangyaensis]|uniref:Uncharacterized protein n=1 Tax=Nocardia mangyaensis TaxID=2213200 RepID=A0A1J0VTC6_9NOCA|nr:hypothetical protein [Nocardia mangyaensis]APE35183.1 hypothetical protein BOX37_15900 [Nocardia mangyaensis]